jgi:hypothetical protein
MSTFKSVSDIHKIWFEYTIEIGTNFILLISYNY